MREMKDLNTEAEVEAEGLNAEAELKIEDLDMDSELKIEDLDADTELEIEDLDEILEDEPVEEDRAESRRRQTIEEVEEEVDAFLARLHGKEEKKKGFRQKRERTDEERGRGRKKLLIAFGVLAAICFTAAGTYAAMAQKYNEVYFPNTQINGIDASGKTADEVKTLISAESGDYVLTIETRGGQTEQIAGTDISLHPEFHGALEALLEAQNPYEWGLYEMNLASDIHVLETMLVYDDAALQEQIASLFCMQPENQIEPENAYISEYLPGIGYELVPETAGSVLDEEIVKEAVSSGIVSLRERISLEESGAYKKAPVTAEHPQLMERVETMNRYVGTTITYRFGDKTEILDGDRIHQWIAINEKGQAVIDSGEVIRYVEELAIEYNTANKAKKLKTSYGKTVTVRGGSYGWRINQSKEADALAELIRAGESQVREPIYGQKAASHGANDYGDTYVEINLTAQHLFFYKDGKLIVESDFVSGNESKGWGTPAGTYSLTYKERDAVLNGEDYETPVDYWMPFNGGIGMHDATWRGSFGGKIYKTNGSHGCINLPHSAAEKIYENISAGVPVICYHLEGSEKGSTSVKEKKPTETKPAETKPAETKSAVVIIETTAASSPAGESSGLSGNSSGPSGNSSGPSGNNQTSGSGPSSGS